MPQYTGERNDLIPQFGIAMYLLRGDVFRIEDREFHEIEMNDIRRVIVALTGTENFGGTYRSPAAPTRHKEPRWRHACLQLKNQLQMKQPHRGVPALHLRETVSGHDGSVFSETAEARQYVLGAMRAEPKWRHLADSAPHSYGAAELVGSLWTSLERVDDWIQQNWAVVLVEPPPAPSIPPDRRRVEINQIQRDAAIVLELKEFYEWECQLCGVTIELPDGNRYAEAHHVHPLGEPHNSNKDCESNLLIVCPNCHVRLDYGAVGLDLETINVRAPHRLDAESVRYHNERILRCVRTSE